MTWSDCHTLAPFNSYLVKNQEWPLGTANCILAMFDFGECNVFEETTAVSWLRPSSLLPFTVVLSFSLAEQNGALQQSLSRGASINQILLLARG